MHDHAVYFVTDDRYAPYAFAAARRVRALSTAPFDCIVFVDGESGCDFPEIEVRHFRAADIVPPVVRTKRLPLAAYARMFVVDAYLGKYQRVLYLDSDIAIHGSIDPIFDLARESDTLLAVQSFRRLMNLDGWEAYARQIGINPDRYFNSGVMLLNVPRFTALPIRSAFERFYSEHNAILQTADQDFLNHLLGDDWVDLPPEWNYQFSLVKRGIVLPCEPVITHYTGDDKPWRAGFRGARRHRDYFRAIGAPVQSSFFMSSRLMLRAFRRRLLRGIVPKYRLKWEEWAAARVTWPRRIAEYYASRSRVAGISSEFDIWRRQAANG